MTLAQAKVNQLNICLAVLLLLLLLQRWWCGGGGVWGAHMGLQQKQTARPLSCFIYIGSDAAKGFDDGGVSAHGVGFSLYRLARPAVHHAPPSPPTQEAERRARLSPPL